MYTFTDRSRPLAHAAARRAPRRSPAPTSSTGCTASRSRSRRYTIAPMYRYGAPGPRPLPRALAALARGDRLGRPGDRRRGDPASTPSCSRRLGVERLGAAPQLDRRRRPAARPTSQRLNAWLDAHDDAARRGGARTSARRARCRCSTSRTRRCARRSRTRRRSASRSATPAASTSTRSRRSSTASASPTRSTRRSCAGSTTTRARPSSSSGRTRTSNSTICGGGRYDGLVEAIGGPPTPGIGFGAGIERLAARARAEGVERRRAGARRLLRRSTARPPAFVLETAERSAARRLACDTDYAGRSLKGQLTQARRTGARDARDRRAPTTRRFAGPASPTRVVALDRARWLRSAR